MSSTVVVIPHTKYGEYGHCHLLAWVNGLLKTDFKDVQQMGSGACHCQIMDCVIPGSVDMAKVRFDAQGEEDYKHNFRLLGEALSRNGIPQTIPVDKLINGDFKSNFEMLTWLKAFHTANAKSKEYDPVKARGSRDIHPMIVTTPQSGSSAMESCADESGTGATKELPYNEKWKAIFDWADRSALGEKYTYCRSCNGNVGTFQKGLVALERHKQTKEHQNAGRQSHPSEPLPCSDKAVRFIHKHCYAGRAEGEQASRHFARRKLGLKYPKDIASVCQHTPYCVYMYGRVALGEDDAVSVVLVGFFDVITSRHRIRFLDAFQSEDGSGDRAAAAVVETLRKFALPMHNLAAVYSVGDGATSEKILSSLREFNPNVVAFDGLYNIADAACRAGVKKLSSQVQELMGDIHAHYSSCSTKSNGLRALFGSDVGTDSPFHLNTGCLKLCLSVTQISETWTDLVLYFESCSGDDDKARSICSQLQDPNVRATFLFLAQALRPLHSFQRLLQTHEGAARADVVLVLEQASSLLCTYTGAFLQPQAACRFLKEHDAQILTNEQCHLLSPGLGLGGKAAGGSLNESETTGELTPSKEEALSFYIALTGCIAEELPLRAGMLKSIAQLLSPQGRLEVTGHAVGELGTKLGVCRSPEEVNQLASEFLEYQSAEEGENDNSAAVPLEEHWARVLKDVKQTSAFRKLVLTLLAFPCPPLDSQQVFAKSLETEDAPPFPERDAETDDECEVVSCSAPADGASDRERLLHHILKPCVVRLTRIDEQTDDHYAMWKKGGETSLSSEPKRRGRPKSARRDGKGFLTGELVWARVKGFSWWPAMVVPCKTKSAPTGMQRVQCFGDGKFLEISAKGLMPFGAFSKCFCKDSFASSLVYKEAIFQIIELAGERCSKPFAEADGNKEKELKLMLDWAFEGFLPTGPEGFVPPGFQNAAALHISSDSAPEYQPPAKRKHVIKNKANSFVINRNRGSIAEMIKEKGKTIEEFCLPCGSSEVFVPHPLFEGGLCLKCKENFTETLYRYDEYGYQSYCTVCCTGFKVILCGNASCCRCFCKYCLDTLVGPGTYDKLKDVDPWSCYICNPSQCEGNLKLRPDWSVKVQDFFVNNSALQFEPHRVYPSIPAYQRRPIRVLSLFDGVATASLVLRYLGFKIERYIAAAICEDPIAVAMVKHEGKIEYVNDVRSITRKHLAEWGPFDLLIGGSPCNDLSMVNPLRKGLFEGTGKLFFEFYRILTMLKTKVGDKRPFFWLFENVVFMSANDKSDICRFLECNPVFIDAVKVSPAHRARYFWGNLPGMNRPLATSLDDKVALQHCLEIGRYAKFDKGHTITTQSNSIRRGKMNTNGKADSLWCTEIEQVFGFPKHYTDVNNMGQKQRQKVLGRSWSVSVIRHLFAPLKDYFECEQRP